MNLGKNVVTAKNRGSNRNEVRIGVELTNFAELSQTLRALPASMESRIMGDAVGEALKPILEIAKSKAPSRSGALRRSLIAVVKRYPKTGKILGLVGPDRDYYRGGKRVKEGESRKGADKPANYAHLIEFGFHVGSRTGIFGGFKKGTSRRAGTAKATAFVMARPFMRPAAALGAPLAMRKLADGVAIGQQRELGRLKSKLKRVNK